MHKFCLTLLLLLCIHLSFGQWARISSLPAKDIISLAVHNDDIYASSDNKIYKSNNGVHWTTLTVSNNPVVITNIYFFGDTLYAGTLADGIFSSADGTTWQNHGAGLAYIAQFAARNGVLYAATVGSGVAVMEAKTHNWSPLNGSLPTYSENVDGIIATPSYMMIAAGANGTFYNFDFTNSNWTEELYYGILRPGLLIKKIINQGDTIFAVNGNRIIRSNDAGSTWVDDKNGTHDGGDRTICAGTVNHYTLTNEFPTGTWIQQRNKMAGDGTSWAMGEQYVPDGYAYDLVEFKSNLYLAKADGLYSNDLILGLEDSNNLNIYPNPSSGIVNIESDKEIISLEMSNALGQVVYKTPVNNAQFQFKSTVTGGLYYLTLKQSDGVHARKIIIRD